MANGPTPRLEALGRALEHAAHYLPAQGPIGIFIHHNTLHAFEHLPFEDAVARAAELFGAEPYPAEAEYREAFRTGRIEERDLVAVLEEELGEDASRPCAAGLAPLELWRHGLVAIVTEQNPTAWAWQCEEGQLYEELAESLPGSTLSALSDRTLAWAAGDGDAARRCLSGAEAPRDGRLLGLACLHGACRLRLSAEVVRESKPSIRLHDDVLEATGRDSDAFVNPTLIHLVSAFLDQGVAYWRMPNLERGLYVAARDLLAQPGSPPNEWTRRVSREMRRLAESGMSAGEVVLDVLDELELVEEDWGPFIEGTLLSLPGWAGMVHQLEVRPDRAPTKAPPASLLDYLALRLALERVALLFIAELRGLAARTLSEVRALLRASRLEPSPVQDTSLVQAAFLAFLHAGKTAADVLALSDSEVLSVRRELRRMTSVERRRLWHLAYERRHARAVLDPLLAWQPAPRVTAPRFQAVFCIDERCESIRRHVEEVEPRVETWSTAGFFGIAMYYKGLDDAVAMPLCPIAITPRHEVHEQALPGASARLDRRRAQRRLRGRFAASADIGSRTLFRGTILSAALGMLSALPLVLRVLFPRGSARFGEGLGELSLPSVDTALALERESDEATPSGRLLGFSVEEMTDIVERTLGDMGLTSFAPICLLVGHGSSSLNNPHESAHDCGACGGGRGGPNARAFATMANHTEVRSRLRERGLAIPDGTIFVGAQHDTCNDSFEWFDLAKVPASRRAELEELVAIVDRARALDAHERCRRFENVPFGITPEEALRRVEERAVDLAQPRPEYGHATNAFAVIGRRARTRGLFLDRRAFLVSYDPDDDADGAKLVRLLRATLPVMAGINLEYYFSYVDPVRYGCNTKLPHNITSLLGVMDGYMSDLRTGLPWQMVEIHEPVRLLTVVEATPERLAAALEAAGVARLVEQRWVRMVALDPSSARAAVWRDGGFVPYRADTVDLGRAETSRDVYAGRREHLPIRRVVRASLELTP